MTAPVKLALNNINGLASVPVLRNCGDLSRFCLGGGEREDALMAKPKTKPKAKKLTAREKKARATRAAFDKVCDLIADGPKESVKEITADSKIGINRSGFYHLLRARDDELLDRYAQARAMQADRFAGEIIAIADGANNDTVNKARLQFDARRWMAGKLAPKVYGERQTVDVNHNLPTMDDDELLAHAKKLAATYCRG